MKYIPGTAKEFENMEAFEGYKNMIEMAGGITLGQICTITNLETHMIQNWVKRGYIPRPVNKKYYTKHLSRILLINALRECMRIEDIGQLMVLINGDVDDESDDIISEEDLYKTFSKIVYRLDDYRDIEKIIEESISEDERLQKCMKIMVYAYASSQMAVKANELLDEFRK